MSCLELELKKRKKYKRKKIKKEQKPYKERSETWLYGKKLTNILK